MILWMRPANERWRYLVTSSLIGWLPCNVISHWLGVFTKWSLLVARQVRLLLWHDMTTYCAVSEVKIGTENWELLWCQHCYHWWHCRLSFMPTCSVTSDNKNNVMTTGGLDVPLDKNMDLLCFVLSWVYCQFFITVTSKWARWHLKSLASQLFTQPFIYSGSDQRKHQSSASLAFVQGIHRWPVNSLHKWPVMRKMFPFDDVFM